MYAKFKKMITDELNKVIGGSSSQHQYEDEAGTPESYVRNGGEKENMSENIEKTTTEPDPTGDIAVLKSVDSDLARRKIQKAIISLEKAMANLPSVGRASSVSVANETAPVSKAVDTDDNGKTDLSRPTSDDVSSAVTKSASDYLYSAKKAIKKALDNLPDAGRPTGVSVSQEAGPINKNVGSPDSVEGVGENSKPANDTVSQDAEPMTKVCTCGDCPECLSKAACCKAAGSDCTGDCCSKCACMGVKKAADTDNDGDTDADTDNDDDSVTKSANEVVTESQSKTTLDMINDAKANVLSKSVWGGAFDAPKIPRVK